MTILTSGEQSTGLIQQGKVLSIASSTSALVQILDGDVEVDKFAVGGARLIGPYYKNFKFRITSLSGSTEYSVVEAGNHFQPASFGNAGVDRGIYADGEKVANAVATNNKLINVYPTLRAAPYAGNDDQSYTTFNATADVATIAIDTTVIDPSTGRAMAKVTIPTGSTLTPSIDYLDLTPWQMQSNDVWMLSVYLPNRLSGSLNVQMLVTDGSTFAGVEYRLYTFTGDMLQKGFNLLTCMHVEDLVGASEYGRVATTSRKAWQNNGSQSASTLARSIRVRAGVIGAQGTDTIVYFGGIHTAPAGWAKGAVMWMADDVPNSFYELAIPVIESYGWKCTLANTSTYSSDPGVTYMPMAAVRDCNSRGHEIWGHLRRHEDMDATTTDQKTRSLKSAADFWKSIGINTASQYMAWPFGRINDEAITIAKAQGYKIAASIRGDGMNPLIAGTNPYYINRYSIEVENSWHVDSMINGTALRGVGLITYAHNAIAGGAESDVYPGAVSFYVDHLKRWCDLAASLEDQSKLVVTTPLEYFRMCGINPETHQFAE